MPMIPAAQPQQLDEVFGQSALAAKLKSSAASGRISHAMVFLGERGTGKRGMALLFGRALLCENPHEGEPCNACPACAKCASGNHPDLHLVERPAKRAHIDVDSIRAITAALAFKAYTGGRIVVVIDDAHTMTPSAQNALLKTLEEPPEGCTILLLCQTTATLLPTILSRCVTHQMALLTPGQIAGYLEARGAGRDEALAAARMARGSLGRAVELAGDPERIAQYQTQRALLISLVQGRDTAQAVVQLQGMRGKLSDTLDIWELFLRDALIASTHTHVDASADPTLSALSPDALASMLEACLAAREHVQASVIHTVVVDALVGRILPPARGYDA